MRVYNNCQLKLKVNCKDISQWLQATVEFSTLDMARAFNSSCTDYDVACKEVQRVLTPLEGLQDVVHGDVFTYRTLSGGHTGFVAQKINDSCFDALSYSRNMPKIEGLGYNVFCEEDGKQYMYFAPRQNLEIEGYCDVCMIVKKRYYSTCNCCTIDINTVNKYQN